MGEAGLITIGKESTFDELFGSPVGTIVRVEGDYETALRRVEDSKPTSIVFRMTPITAGTSLFTLYGPNHLVVAENRPV